MKDVITAASEAIIKLSFAISPLGGGDRLLDPSRWQNVLFPEPEIVDWIGDSPMTSCKVCTDF